MCVSDVSVLRGMWRAREPPRARQRQHAQVKQQHDQAERRVELQKGQQRRCMGRRELGLLHEQRQQHGEPRLLQVDSASFTCHVR